MHGGPASSSRRATLWVRSCTGCAQLDVRSAWGRAELVDRHGWSCPHCGHTKCTALAVAMP
jgi:hypothetical protein